MPTSSEKSAIYDMSKDMRKNGQFEARFPSNIFHFSNKKFVGDDSIQDVRRNELFEVLGCCSTILLTSYPSSVFDDMIQDQQIHEYFSTELYSVIGSFQCKYRQLLTRLIRVK